MSGNGRLSDGGRAGSGVDDGRRGRGGLPISRWAPPLAAALALLAAWQLYVDLAHVSPLVLPSPHAVAVALASDRGTLWRNLLRTGSEILLGILLATFAASAIAILVHFSKLAERALYPLVVASQALPVVIIAPILVLWLGFGLLPKLVVIALVCFFPIVVTTLAGLESVDPTLLSLMRSFGANRAQTFRLIELPTALPGLFTGLKLAAVFSVIGAVFAEQAGANAGLGYLLTITISNLQMAEAFAAVVVLCAFAIVLFMLLGVIERRVLPWAYSSEAVRGR
jgi:ABC-type nitrate/sulfonate/bicarbonate transport system permease component